MALRIGQVERTGACSNRADQTLAETKLGQVNSLRIKTFGRVEFENAIGAQYIEGADFRDHVLRDFTDDPVKARLRFQRLRHQFAQPLEQYAGTGCQLTHDRRGLLSGCWRAFASRFPNTRPRCVTPIPL